MSKKKRIKKLRNLLLEMGAGKFFYRVERSGKNDNVEALVSIINMMGEEIEEALVHQGYANASETIKHIVVMHFMLDAEGKIVAVNPQVCTLLYYLCEEIIGQPLTQLLDERTVRTWEGYREHQRENKSLENAVELIFRTKTGLLIPSACYENVLMDEQGTKEGSILTVVKHTKRQVSLEQGVRQNIKRLNTDRFEEEAGDGYVQKRKKVRLTYEDILKIGEARDMLINNVDKEIPSLREFALAIGTNTFKLKYGFKELYGISVFRFLRNERLRKAKMLVQYGDRPFKTIAYLCGFKSVPHFTRTFKSEFGYTPTELRNGTFTDET